MEKIYVVLEYMMFLYIRYHDNVNLNANKGQKWKKGTLVLNKISGLLIIFFNYKKNFHHNDFYKV